MIIAAIFHDIVYDPQRKDNEEKSIELLEFYTSESKYSDIIQQSKEIILSTKTHDKIHDLISNFNKFDCSILDKDLPDLLIWEEQIRKEYSFVPLDEYKKGRLEFLNLSLPNHQNNKENILQLIKIISPDCWWNISNHFKV
jgi:predicted metal-dependent HD superfamily phosphohydrolase